MPRGTVGAFAVICTCARVLIWGRSGLGRWPGSRCSVPVCVVKVRVVVRDWTPVAEWVVVSRKSDAIICLKKLKGTHDVQSHAAASQLFALKVARSSRA